jgi:ABC-type sugar transport system permease subunit
MSIEAAPAPLAAKRTGSGAKRTRGAALTTGGPASYNPAQHMGTAGRDASRSRHGHLRDTLAGWLFVSPATLIIGVFGFFPVFFTLFVSAFRWRLNRGKFSGLDNYAILFGGSPVALVAVLAAIVGAAAAVFLIRGSRAAEHGTRAGGSAAARLTAGFLLLAASAVGFVVALPYLAAGGDKDVFDSLRVTIWYTVCTVPVQLAGGLILAVLLTRKMKGRQAFRVLYLVPYIAPTVATAAVFELLFSLRPDAFANQVLKLVGVGPLQWLQEPKGIFTLLFGAGPDAGQASAGIAAVIPSYWGEWAQGPSLALTAIVFYSWWVFIGYYALIYMNGLGAIPRQLHEAAEVDGAGPARRFFSITLPLLSPTTYFLTMLGVIGTFKAFTHLYVLRNTAASGTVDPVSVLIFFTAFRKGNMGYASVISILLFVIVLGLTWIQQRAGERNVTYGD